MTKLIEHDLNEIVAAVIERLKGEYDLTLKAPKPEPATPPAKTILGFDSLGLPRLVRLNESQERDARDELEQIIDRLAAEREAAFKPSANDTSAYAACPLCQKEFFTVESYNLGHICTLAGRTPPYIKPNPTRPGRYALAADAQWKTRQSIVAEAQEILNRRNQKGAENHE